MALSSFDMDFMLNDVKDVTPDIPAQFIVMVKKKLMAGI